MDRKALHIRELQQALDRLPLDKIDQVIAALHKARINGKHVFVLGVGSSAVVAFHFVGDLCAIPRQRGGAGFKAISLTEYATMFSMHMEGEDIETLSVNRLDNLLSRGDTLVIFSISGSSRIALRAVELANRRGATTIGITGEDEGRITSLVDIGICIPTKCVEYIQEIHLIVQNIITQSLREKTLPIPALTVTEKPIPKANPLDHSSLFRSLTVEYIDQPSSPERSRAQVELFSELSNELAHELELRDLLSRVLRLTLNKFRASSGTFVVLNERLEAVEGSVFFNGEAVPYTVQPYSEIIERGLAGWVVKNRQAALIRNTRDDPRWLPRSWDEENRSAICVPVLDNDRVNGVLTLVTKQPGGFSEEDLSLLAAVTMFINFVNYAI
jgi:D-sedoheptulose 7-phosphate isomerase